MTTYKQSGVDIDAGDELVERIKPLARFTRTPFVVSDVGGFAGLCSIPKNIIDPVLVSGTDGVGTKLKIAVQLNKHNTIGQDLVGMCVNDIITCGARPLFFLDYFATGKLNVDEACSVISGIASACKECECALLGGETAEMPGMYSCNDYDLAGFAVGVVGRSQIINGSKIGAGDVVIGLPSSGLHSNGYSLARNVLNNSYMECPPELNGYTIGEALIVPTKLYWRHVAALQKFHINVLGMCHVTGGGLPGNLPRILPNGLGVKITTVPRMHPIFDIIADRGAVSVAEMRRTFNCGIGFVFVVRAFDASKTMNALRANGECPIKLGVVVDVPADTDFENRVMYPHD
jgi:phosphoribosylformylglycinamidine cyclo-ligase